MFRFVLAVSVLFAGCGEAPVDRCGPAAYDVAGACVLDDAAMRDLVENFDDGRLVKVNREPFLQVVGDSMLRNVWISELPVPDTDLTTVDLYRSIDPGDGTAVLEDAFPSGTVILHETVDRVEGHGVQVKLDGYENDSGQPWWFGKVFDDGTDDLDACIPCVACHTDIRTPTEGLWGVPHEYL